MIDVDTAIAGFIADLDVLFANHTDNGYAQFVYFDADLRVPIMHAARTQTFLKIRYKGDDRVVEPYSLKYLQRRDGKEREYLFVFNRSGGNNPPGIRCFVPENIELIENTDERFEPQYQIELSKAGEIPENPYLFDSNKAGRPPRVRRTRGVSRRASTGMKYIYRCSHCGRTFIRRTHGSTMRPHKNKGGYPCYGSHGIYVGTKY